MSEFARPVRLDTIGDAPRRIALEADPSERAALAARFALVAIDRLTAVAELVREGDVVRASGTLAGDVVQSCVATGADLAASIEECFALTFVPAQTGPIDEIELDEHALDILTYEDGGIDLGEAVAQTLILALDPFPRAPDAEEALRRAGVTGEGQAGPFAVLRGLNGSR